MAYADPEVGKRKSRERFRERMAERRAAGRCLSCGRVPPVPGRTNCEPCAERKRARDRERNARMKAGGKPRRDPVKAREAGRRHYRRKMAARAAGNACRRCGRRPPAPGRINCHECGEKLRAAARERYHAGREAGLAYGGRPAESRRRSARIRSERKRREWIAAGKCSRCGAREPTPDGTTCTPCRTRRQERDKAKYAQRRAMGHVFAVEPPPPSTARRCAFPVPRWRRTAVARSGRTRRRDGATWRGAGLESVPIAGQKAMAHRGARRAP